MMQINTQSPHQKDDILSQSNRFVKWQRNYIVNPGIYIFILFLSTFQASALSIDETVQDATCAGSSDGSIDISVSGGVKPYTYSWSNGAATEDITGVSAGSYSVTVTDANASTVSSSFTVNEPSALSLSFSTSVDTSNGPATCDGDPASTGFAFKANHTIKTMVQDSATVRSRFSLDATAIGPALADFNQNGINDLVLLNNKDTIQLWDKLAGLHTTIDISADPAHTDKSLLAVGHWNGSGSSIFYADADLKEIYRVKPDQSPSKVIKAGNGTNAVSGIADIDGDGADELVFVDASQEVRYIDDDQSISTTAVTIGFNNGIGIGRPLDYNGNGKASIPAVGGGNEILMLGPNGNRETILSGTATKAPIAPVDVDCDNEHELIFRNTNNQLRYIEDVRGTNTVKTFVDDNGNQVVVDQTGIINTGLSNADFGKGSASVSVSGGTSPYSYSWSNGVNGQSIDGINDGSYSVTVTDSNNCSSVDSVNVDATNLNCVWDGSESTDWHTGANWSCGSVPASSDSVTIPVDVPNMPLISDTAKSGAITIDSGATVSFSGSGSPFLAVHGDLVSNGSIDYSSGEVKMKGDSKQKITGSDEIKVYNLMIDNSRSSFPQIVLDVRFP
ncbi:MAG: hypothetical protein BRD50_05205 [Bacteroidetes bacterium SW_11_45_7]|nr:MAG: hypothetical protein BRD50_05205 [Bacteroidetes bacterium SW_11_45_7]